MQGTLCDTPFCAVEPCKNGGFCLTTDISPVCTCSLGYTGMFCKFFVDFLHYFLSEFFYISCGLIISNWSFLFEKAKFKDKYTHFVGETDFNECESMPCQNNGECIDLIGRYQCRCTGTGFEGANCKLRRQKI